MTAIEIESDAPSSDQAAPAETANASARKMHSIWRAAWDILGVLGAIASALFALTALCFPSSPFTGACVVLMALGAALACTVLLTPRGRSGKR